MRLISHIFDIFKGWLLVFRTLKIRLLFFFFIFTINNVVSQTKFAVIGDYGNNTNIHSENVANMVNSWDIDFIATVGDNYYGATDEDFITSWQALDDVAGKYYSQWIGNYQGSYDAQFTNLINKNDS
ncbi:MAG: hypothetical protein O6940_07210 [Ignavibacteria bacterium]|nr:hypothetical protein [Ignavibacteria bacterium]